MKKFFYFWCFLVLVFPLTILAKIPAAPLTKKTILNGAEQFKLYLPLLKNKRVGLLINHSSLVGNTPLVDFLLQQGVNVTTIFSPEHGLSGTVEAGKHLTSSMYADNIPLVSLYGKKLKPDPADLKNLDILLFDIQDVGVRFYTYTSTLQKLMEAAVESNKPLIILDRPNPNGFYVDGPVLAKNHRSFTGMQSVPVVHGMTIGEYARMLVGENWLVLKPRLHSKSLKLTIIPCKYYTHLDLYEPPVPPSPNLNSINSIYLYPSIGLLESTIMSVGRGTKTPFQVFGHPLLSHNLFEFIPTFPINTIYKPFANQKCYGWNLQMTKTKLLRLLNNRLQIKYLIRAYKLFPEKNNFFKFYKASGEKGSLHHQIAQGLTEQAIRASWEPALSHFKVIRKKYLLYPDFN